MGIEAPTINKSLLLTKNFEQTDLTGLLPAAPAADAFVTCANVVVVAYVTGLYRLTVKYSANQIEKNFNLVSVLNKGKNFSHVVHIEALFLGSNISVLEQYPVLPNS